MRDRRRASPALRMTRLPGDPLRVQDMPDEVQRRSRGPGNGELPEIDPDVDAAAGPGEHQGYLTLGEHLRAARFHVGRGVRREPGQPGTYRQIAARV